MAAHKRGEMYFARAMLQATRLKDGTLECSITLRINGNFRFVRGLCKGNRYDCNRAPRVRLHLRPLGGTQ